MDGKDNHFLAAPRRIIPKRLNKTPKMTVRELSDIYGNICKKYFNSNAYAYE